MTATKCIFCASILFFLENPTLVRNRVGRKTSLGVTRSLFLSNRVIQKHIEPITLIIEFSQKVTESLYFNQLSSEANSVEIAFELYKTLKVPFLEETIDLC